MKSLRGGVSSSSSAGGSQLGVASQLHREALQRRTQGDWANREFAELMTGSIKRIADFLTAFHLSCSSRLSDLNSRLTRMERKMEYLEAKVEMRAPAPAHGYEPDYDEEEESYEEDTTGSGPAGRGQAESTA